MMDRVKRGEATRAELRVLAASMIEASFDAQGRLTVDSALREFAGIEPGSQVVVAGSFDRVEIWNPQRYARQTSEGGAHMLGSATTVE